MLAAHLGRRLAPYLWRALSVAVVVVVCMALTLVLTLAGAVTSATVDEAGQHALCGTGGSIVVTPAGPGAAGLSVDGQPVDAEQLANAQVIAATGRAIGVGERGVLVALATAAQESRLRNLPYGDRDSVGLFQQRPSQGWGTVLDLLRPDYAATKFFQALLRVPGWEQLPVTVAAQAVQRSAFPSAYARWEPLAAALVGIPGVRDASVCGGRRGRVTVHRRRGAGHRASARQPAQRGRGDQLGPHAGVVGVGRLVSAVSGVRGAGVRLVILRHPVRGRSVHERFADPPAPRRRPQPGPGGVAVLVHRVASRARRPLRRRWDGGLE